MTIEFNCPNCAKVLKTPDDKAGVTAKCPGCGNPVTVPSPPTGQMGLDGADEYGLVSPSAALSGSTGKMSCPMCGERIPSDATQCEYCGEPLTMQRIGGTRAFAPTTFEAGDALSLSWRIFKPRMGFCIGANVVVGVLNQFGNALIQVVTPAIEHKVLPPWTIFVCLFLAMAFSVYLFVGQSILFLRVARQEPAQISDLFKGGRFVLRFLGIFAVAVGIAMAAVFFMIALQKNLPIALWPAIPIGILLWVYASIVFWPSLLVVIDQDVGVIEALQKGYSLGSRNKLQIIVLFFGMAGLMLAGLCACFVGLLVAAPLVTLSQTVAYLQMSGQSPPEPEAA